MLNISYYRILKIIRTYTLFDYMNDSETSCLYTAVYSRNLYLHLINCINSQSLDRRRAVQVYSIFCHLNYSFSWQLYVHRTRLSIETSKDVNGKRVTNQRWRHLGTRQVGPCTAGSTRCVPSRDAS